MEAGARTRRLRGPLRAREPRHRRAVAQCIPADLDEAAAACSRLADAQHVDLTVVGPELPLSLGVADVFAAAGRAIVGPSRAAAALESSKSFAKDFMERHRVPTARFRVCDSAADALAFAGAGEFGYPAGHQGRWPRRRQGRRHCRRSRGGGARGARRRWSTGRFGSAGDRIVFEEFLVGEEASYFVLADGAAFVPLSSAQDHKRIFDDDRGPNTGGMGAFSPSPLMTPDVERRVLDEIVRPVLAGMEAEGHPYRGFLYVGLMLTADGPKVIEFNVRFGDPEAQVVLPMLDEDLSWLLGAAATGALPSRPARFRDEPHVGVVLARAAIRRAPKAASRFSASMTQPLCRARWCFTPARRRRDGRIVTAGGRVLTVVGRGRSHREAIDIAYRAAAHIRFDGMQMRRDIGRKALGSPLSAGQPLKYAVVTFGCRVNQADSLAIEGEFLARGGVAVAARRGGRCRRQHLLGHGDRRSGRAPDHPPHRPRQSVRRVDRHRLLCDAGPRRAREPPQRRARRSEHPQGRRSSRSLGDEPALSTAERFDGGDGPCGAALAPGVAGRTAFTLRVQTGCDERCSYCIIPTTRGRGRSKPVDEVMQRRPSRGCRRLQGDRASPACISARTGGTFRERVVARRAVATAGGMAGRRAVSRQLARADGLHAGGGVAGRRLAADRAALPSAAAARRRCHAPRHAPAIHRVATTRRSSIASPG